MRASAPVPHDRSLTYGFKPGSEAYGNCRQRIDLARWQAISAAMPVTTTCFGATCISQ